jgi:hypothetical protein
MTFADPTPLVDIIREDGSRVTAELVRDRPTCWRITNVTVRPGDRIVADHLPPFCSLSVEVEWDDAAKEAR